MNGIRTSDPHPGSWPPVVVMGVSGSGKSTVGAALAERLGLDFADADDVHPDANVAKMAAGLALDDTDRAPWLDAVGTWLAERASYGGVMACSALKRAYRDRLRAHAPGVVFVHLDGDEETITRRQAERRGHFMPASLEASQFAALERLGPDEAGVVVDVAGRPGAVVEDAVRRLVERRGPR